MRRVRGRVDQLLLSTGPKTLLQAGLCRVSAHLYLSVVVLGSRDVTAEFVKHIK